MPEAARSPSPLPFFRAVNAYQQTEALKAAIELDLFTAIAEGKTASAAIAERVGVPERGARILSDYLVTMGLLEKTAGSYALTQDSALFLDRRSPAYLGGALAFLLSDEIRGAFGRLTECVRKGGTCMDEEGTLVRDNPIWVTFARAMAPVMAQPAERLAQRAARAAGPLKVLDLAAGHGLFGIAVARRNAEAQVFAVDWPSVLEVAHSNAVRAGVENRHHLLPGSAFEREFGEGYDLALVTNFLHHFDRPTCEALLRKIRTSLGGHGQVAILDFIPNDDRVTPPEAAAFSLTMLVSTPLGDTHTYADLDAMCKAAGFAGTELVRLDSLPAAIVLGHC
ncbi:MAG: class I SAM-dependent methyltransferase [Acidobacteriota bacterium]